MHINPVNPGSLTWLPQSAFTLGWIPTTDDKAFIGTL